MHLNIDFNPQVSAQLAEAARSRGVDPATLLESLVREHLPPITEKSAPKMSAEPKLTAETDPGIALMESWLAAAPTDPKKSVRPPPTGTSSCKPSTKTGLKAEKGPCFHNATHRA